MIQTSHEPITQTTSVVLPVSAGGRCHSNPVHPEGKPSRQAAASSPCKDGHEWVVFSTMLGAGYLKLQCVECGMMGTVEDPSEEEWSGAFHAPSRPDRWNDVSRVAVTGPSPIHVIRATGGPKCECYARGLRVEPGEYERFPAEIMGPLPGLDDEARGELREFADFVGKSDLCSLLFPHFVHFEEDTGFRHPEAIKEAAGRIEEISERGLHFSPGVVAKVLRDLADGAVTPVAGLRKKHRPKDPIKACRRLHKAASRAASPRQGAR